jgi:hypothetical protein
MNIFYIIFNFLKAFFETIHPQLKSDHYENEFSEVFKIVK